MQLHKNASPNTRKIFDNRKLNEFTEFLQNQLQDFPSIVDPERASTLLIDTYSEAIDKFSKLIKCTRKNSAIKPWISSAILTSINTRNTLFNIKLKNPTQANKAAYSRHRNCLNLIIREAKKRYVKEQLALNKNNSKQMWHVLNAVIKGGSQKANVQKQFVDTNGVIIEDRKDIAESFNTFFSTVGNNLQKHIPKSRTSPLTNVKCNPTCILAAWEPTNDEELLNVIKEMKNVGAGVDNINANIFKKTYLSIINHLVHFVNLCLTKGIFPNNLKCVVVKPIYKSGSKSDMNNYRQISILPYTYLKNA